MSGHKEDNRIPLVQVSNYEVDAIVAKVVKQVVSEIRFTATVIIAIGSFWCGVILSVLLG